MVETELGLSLRELGRFVPRTGLQVSDSMLREFLPVHLKNFHLGQPVPFTLYTPLYSPRKKKVLFGKILDGDAPYTEELRGFLEHRGISSVYVHTLDLPRLAAFLEQSVSNCINSPGTPWDGKTQVIYNHAEFLVERAFRDPDLGRVVEDATKWSSMVGEFLKKYDLTPAYLRSIFSRDYSTFTHSIQVCLLGMAFGSYLNWVGVTIEI